jgi:hypothetical protein
MATHNEKEPTQRVPVPSQDSWSRIQHACAHSLPNLDHRDLIRAIKRIRMPAGDICLASPGFARHTWVPARTCKRESHAHWLRSGKGPRVRSGNHFALIMEHAAPTPQTKHQHNLCIARPVVVRGRPLLNRLDSALLQSVGVLELPLPVAQALRNDQRRRSGPTGRKG